MRKQQRTRGSRFQLVQRAQLRIPETLLKDAQSLLTQLTQQHTLASLAVITDQCNAGTVAQRFDLENPLLQRCQRLPSSIPEAEHQAFTLTAGDHREQVRPGIPPDNLLCKRQPPQILTVQLQAQRLGNGLIGLKQQSQAVLHAEPAMRDVRGHGTGCHGGAIHRSAELNIQSSSAGTKWLNGHGLQPGRSPQQNLLLNYCQSCQRRQTSQQEPRPGRCSLIGHGSSGRSGLGIAVISVGLTTLTGTPLRSCTVIVPSIASH